MLIRELKELIKGLPDDMEVYLSHELVAHPGPVTDAFIMSLLGPETFVLYRKEE